ncbi:MAG: TrmH family RNA methyltransferase [Alkaliphilus sp.]
MIRNCIDSESNKIIKHTKSLKIRKNRIKNNQFLIEGVRIISEAINNNAIIEYVLCSNKLQDVNGGQELLDLIEKRHDIYLLAAKAFSTLSETKNSQGIIAVIKKESFSLDTIINKKNLLLLVLDRIQDPGNMGAIIRTAKAVNVDAIILTKGCVDIYNSKTLRATMGALFGLPVLQFDDNDEWINKLKRKKARIIATSLNTKCTYLDISYTGSIAIIMGNEANGIDEVLLSESDELIKIPMFGEIESLNVTASAAVILYKAIEKRFCK